MGLFVNHPKIYLFSSLFRYLHPILINVQDKLILVILDFDFRYFCTFKKNNN